MILVVSAEFPASFSLQYKFIMHNYVQFGTISNPCLGEALCLGLKWRIKYFLCLEGAVLSGQGCVTYGKGWGRNIVSYKNSSDKWILDFNCAYHLKLLTLRIFIQTKCVDNSSTNGHIDFLPATLGTSELRSMKIFYSPNPGIQGRMQNQFRRQLGKKFTDLMRCLISWNKNIVNLQKSQIFLVLQ